MVGGAVYGVDRVDLRTVVVGRLDRQDAGQRGGHRVGRAAPGEGQVQAGPVDAHHLRGGVVDRRLGVGEVRGVPDRLGLEAGRGEIEAQEAKDSLREVEISVA